MLAPYCRLLLALTCCFSGSSLLCCSIGSDFIPIAGRPIATCSLELARVACRCSDLWYDTLKESYSEVRSPPDASVMKR